MLQPQGKNLYRTGIGWVAGSGMLALASLGGWALYGVTLNRVPEAIAVRLQTVERGTVETVISESGTVELGGQQTLVSPAEGAVERVLVQAGDRVTTGQVLITLRNPDRQTALLDQQVQIQQQQVALAQNQAQIAEAQAQLITDQQQLQNLTRLAEVGAISRERAQAQETQVRATQRTLRDATAAVQTASLEIQKLQLQRQRTQQELQGTIIAAPINGLVLGVEVKDGDGVDRRTQLLTLGNPAQEVVKLKLSTLNAAQVELNQMARVSVIGPDATVFTGRVRALYPQAIASDDSSGGSSASGQVTVPTTVLLDRPTQTLIPGSQVSVEIVLQQRQNVVVLDVETIQQGDSKPFVWVVDEANTVRQQPVTLGLEGLTQVEVTTGLQVGDRIAVPTPDLALTPGMQVTSAPASLPGASPEVSP